MSKEIIKLWDKLGKKFGCVGPTYWDDFGRRLVSLSSIKEGDYVLDIGIGRGAVLFPAAKKVKNKGKVWGVDVSSVMVYETEKEIKNNNLENIEVLCMDGANLNFKEDTFDVVTSGFSIGYILNCDKELESILKVLKRDGYLALSLWGIQKDQEWLNKIVDEYIPKKSCDDNELEQLNTVQGVKKLLERLNLKDIKIYEEDNLGTLK